MKHLVTLISLVGAAVAWTHPKQVQDTPEVAAAKAAHLAALAQAKQEARTKPKANQWRGSEKSPNADDGKLIWKGNWGNQQWNEQVDTNEQQENDGQWQDDGSWKNYDDGSWKGDAITEPENQQNSNSEPKWDGQEKKWTGPVALPPGYDESGAPLPVQDTPEVAKAKAKHLILYARAASQKPKSSSIYTDPVPQVPVLTAPIRPQSRQATPRRTIPQAPAPVWEPPLRPFEDTPEVAAVKAFLFGSQKKKRHEN